jgi:hypothetical protein
MPIPALVAAIQTRNPETQSGGNPSLSGYLVFAMVAVILGLVVVMFIRTRVRRSSKGGDSRAAVPRRNN